ncbi:hypothetical protein QBC45DRAFT_334315, partial [Copromyces sp. CBS 386.78]
GVITFKDFKCSWSVQMRLPALQNRRTNASVCWPSDEVPIQGRPRSEASSPLIHP